MGAAGNKKPKGMKKKHEASYVAEEATQQTTVFNKKAKKNNGYVSEGLRKLALLPESLFQDCFFNRSRISVNSCSSLVGAGGGVGFVSSLRFILLISFTNKNIEKAIMRKSRAVLMKFP